MLAGPFAAEGQPSRIAKVGTLALGGPERGIERRGPAHLREGLRELGWIEGRNLVVETRFAEGRRERLGALAGNLVGLPVEVIVAFGTAAALAARQATDRLPIVMAASGDPVGAGLVASLARPGGNVTGLSLQFEIAPKWLELLKEVVPTAARATIISGEGTGTAATGFREMAAVAPRLGLTLQQVIVSRSEDLDAAFAGRPDGVVIQPNPRIDELRGRIAELALRHRVPTVASFREYAEDGVLLSYSADLGALHRRAATYVDRILKGAKPADLPVEQPTKFELVINLKTAKALGLTIPPSVLARADELIQ
jgi:putative ABC transport system substrate-binding protein